MSKIPENPNELFDFLLSLAQELKENKHVLLAEEVESSAFVRSSASEFLGETRIALYHVVQERPQGLSSTRIEEIDAVIARIIEAFRRVGNVDLPPFDKY